MIICLNLVKILKLNNCSEFCYALSKFQHPIFQILPDGEYPLHPDSGHLHEFILHIPTKLCDCPPPTKQLGEYLTEPNQILIPPIPLPIHLHPIALSPHPIPETFIHPQYILFFPAQPTNVFYQTPFLPQTMIPKQSIFDSLLLINPIK